MSRSNPNDNQPNPSTRWFEWNGEQGEVRYFDKEAKSLKNQTKKGANIVCKLPFTFIMLDELATVKGWHDASDSGIYSNEVRDTRAETLVVKSFKGGVLAEGFYSQIRDRVGNVGGYFVSNNYIAYKDAPGFLKLGVIQFKGASLNSLVEFKKSHRAVIYKQAVKITGFVEGKKGNIIFRTPVFEIQPITEKTDAEAKALDMLLQNYLKGYLSRTRSEQVAKPTQYSEEHPSGYIPDDEAVQSEPPEEPTAVPEPEEEQIPF